MDPQNQRESFGSRLGFILVSAGCAIGIGNVWRFPTVTGQYGGGIFVLFYLLFLVLMGLPVLTMELAVTLTRPRAGAQTGRNKNNPRFPEIGGYIFAVNLYKLYNSHRCGLMIVRQSRGKV